MNGLVDEVCEATTKIVNGRCDKTRIREIVETQSSKINQVWKNGTIVEKERVNPSKELLNSMYSRFGLNYYKSKDGERIVRLIKEDEIPTEIISVINELRARNS